MNHAYAMLLSSQFQGFCRDLHTEARPFALTIWSLHVIVMWLMLELM